MDQRDEEDEAFIRELQNRVASVLVIPGHSIAPKGRRKPKGERVEFRVIRERNGLAVSETAGEEKPLRLPAHLLAQRLGVEVGDLVGRRYTCLVVRDRWGMNLSDYRLL